MENEFEYIESLSHSNFTRLSQSGNKKTSLSANLNLNPIIIRKFLRKSKFNSIYRI